MSRVTNAGIGRRGVRPSTRPSVAKNSALRTGFGLAVDRAFECVGHKCMLYDTRHFVPRDPTEPLPPSA
jgi:hypothetical protein